MKKIETIVSIGMLLFAIGFNLWLYKSEPTALVDPNDNAFQYALVDRTNQIWDFAQQNCPKHFWSLVTCRLPLLTDHWVPNWAVGYNLPFYYSHIPQIVIVASYRLISFLFDSSHITFHLSLFQYFHLVIYLLLCLFPVSVYLSLVTIRLSPLIAGIGALIASHISTDGLYGIDPSSYLWRGWGLSSQLFAMIWFPLAIAYAWKYFSPREYNEQPALDARARRKKLFDVLKMRSANSPIMAILMLAATTSGHLGIGIIAFLSIAVIAIAEPLRAILDLPMVKWSDHHIEIKNVLLQCVNTLMYQCKKLLNLFGAVFILLGYWILPILLFSKYHNISWWDPVWKFNSWGWREVLKNLFNGDLFDFGRVPMLTAMVFTGLFASLLTARRVLWSKYYGSWNKKEHSLPSDPYSYFPFALLFTFWLLLYFGRTTWGNLLNVIPGMNEFHQSRFIVGLHMAGLFLMPIGFQWLILRINGIVDYVCWLIQRARKRPFSIIHATNPILLITYLLLLFIILPPVYKQTYNYNKLNTELILKANENFLLVKDDIDDLFTTLRSLPPGRVFAGRGGGWGKEFRVAETPYYMHLSTYGVPTTLWLPETWSLNSDTEQYFREDKIEDYTLYNIRYIVAPPSQAKQPFWKSVKETATWKLYTVDSPGYVTTGLRPAIVSVGRNTFINVVRLWIQSDYHKKGLYPELTFSSGYPKADIQLPNFRLIHEAAYQIPNGSLHSLFAEPPIYLPPGMLTKDQLDGSKIQDYSDMTIENEESSADMMFRSRVRVGENCRGCLVILKQTSHPNWRVTVNGKRVGHIDVFPFYPAVLLENPGTYEVVFSYNPSPLKIALLSVSFLTLFLLLRTLLLYPGRMGKEALPQAQGKRSNF